MQSNNHLTQCKQLFKIGPSYICLKCLQHLDNKRVESFGGHYSVWINNNRFKVFEKWLYAEFSEEIDFWKSQDETAISFPKVKEAPIWFCWLQGMEVMPALPMAMFTQVKRHSGGHPVHFICEDNLNQYVQLPRHVFDKYKNHKISAAFYTDIIRFALLREYGGLWVDSTVFINKDIDDTIFDLAFWNVKGLDRRFKYCTTIIGARDWQSYALASQPNSLFSRMVFDLLIKYTEKYDSILEYFFVFYLAKFARESVPIIRNEYHLIPENNTRCELLQTYLLDKSIDICDIRENDTWLYKLSRHIWNDEYIGIINDVMSSDL